MVWSQVCGPTCSSCVLGSSGVSVAPFCRLGLWSHPLPSLVPRWVFFLWHLLDLGWLAAVLPGFLPSFGGELSFPCPGCFCFAVPTVWLSRFIEFFLNSFLGFFLLLPVFADSSVWLRLVLGYPPSVAWRRCVLPWFSVRVLSACPRGAAMPLGASVLQCSGSSRWGHLSPVGSVFFLSRRSSRSLSLLLVGLVPGLSAGSPASGWRCVFWHAFVLVAISPVCSFGMWSPFGSIVSFCYS